MLINRYLTPKIKNSLEQGDVATVYGARQTGKTTLAQAILADYKGGLYLNCDQPDIRERLTNKTSTELKALFGNTQVVVLDEAQRVKDAGLVNAEMKPNTKQTKCGFEAEHFEWYIIDVLANGVH